MLAKTNLPQGSIIFLFIFCLTIFFVSAGFAWSQDLPSDPYERGMVLLKQFKYGEAIASFDQALSNNPNQINAHYYRGRAHAALNQLDAALNDFEATLKIDPNFAFGFVGKAQVAIARKDFNLASEYIAKAQALEPGNAEAFYQRGMVFGYQNKINEAIDSFNKCLEIQPDHAYAHYQLGLAYNQLRRMDLTVTHLEKFLMLAPEAPEAEQVRRLLSSLRG